MCVGAALGPASLHKSLNRDIRSQPGESCITYTLCDTGALIDYLDKSSPPEFPESVRELTTMIRLRAILVLPKCNERIDLRCLPARNQRRQDRNGKEQGGAAEEGYRIVCGYPEQKRFDEPR